MDIKIEGNPGTGNSFCEYHINEVKTLAPQATTVTNTIINNYYGDRKPVRAAPSEAEEKADLVQRQQEILAYVCRLKPFVAPAWKNRYESTWRSILALPEVAAQVYEPGKQKDTTFNRNLVANIIYIIIMATTATASSPRTTPPILPRYLKATRTIPSAASWGWLPMTGKSRRP